MDGRQALGIPSADCLARLCLAGVVKLLEEDHELTLPVMFSQVDPARN